MPSNHLNPFSSCLQSFPASGSFPMSQFLAWGGQSIGVLASASVLPMNIQDWFPLGWTDWISLHSKRLSRVFSNTTVQKHQFFWCSVSFMSQISTLQGRDFSQRAYKKTMENSEFKQLAPTHPASQWPSQNSNLCLSDAKAPRGTDQCLIHLPCGLYGPSS